MNRAIEAAYADSAIDTECPNCHAPAHKWCNNPELNRPRRIPCIARIRLGDQENQHTIRRSIK